MTNLQFNGHILEDIVELQNVVKIAVSKAVSLERRTLLDYYRSHELHDFLQEEGGECIAMAEQLANDDTNSQDHEIIRHIASIILQTKEDEHTRIIEIPPFDYCFTIQNASAFPDKGTISKITFTIDVKAGCNENYDLSVSYKSQEVHQQLNPSLYEVGKIIQISFDPFPARREILSKIVVNVNGNKIGTIADFLSPINISQSNAGASFVSEERKDIETVSNDRENTTEVLPSQLIPIDDISQQIQNLSSTTATLREDVSRLQSELDKSNKEQNHLSTDIKNVKQEISTQCKQDITNLQKQLKEQQQQCVQIQSQLTIALSGIRQEKETNKDAQSKLCQQIEKISKGICAIQRDFESLQQGVHSSITGAQQQINVLKKHVNHFENVENEFRRFKKAVIWIFCGLLAIAIIVFVLSLGLGNVDASAEVVEEEVPVEEVVEKVPIEENASSTQTESSHSSNEYSKNNSTQETRECIVQKFWVNVDENDNRNLSITINDVHFDMIYVEGGTFSMKETNARVGGEHLVTLPDFYIGKCEVTQGLWKAVMETTIRQQRDLEDPYIRLNGEGDQYPMYYISWNDCQEFIETLNNLLQPQLGGKRFALPTEAQWEYAARGGKKSQGYKYAGSDNIDDVAWYGSNSDRTAHKVGEKSPNELGLYDMSGNVYEWCQDSTTSDAYRVCRGGGWYFYNSMCCRVSRSVCSIGRDRAKDHGLRLALIP